MKIVPWPGPRWMKGAAGRSVDLDSIMKLLLVQTVLTWTMICGLAFAEDERPNKLDLLVQFVNQSRSISPYTEASACPQTSFLLSTYEQNTNYIRIKPLIPDLEEFTMCAWIKRYDDASSPTWFNYAIGSFVNSIVVKFTSTTTSLWLNEYGVSEAMPFPANEERHVCFATFMSTGDSYMLVDGQLKDVFHGFSGIIEGGGVFYIGNTQSAMGIVYPTDARYSAQGTLGNFMIWDRVLPYDEYLKMYKDRCYCPSDHIITLEKENVEIFGGATVLPPHECLLSTQRQFY